MLAPARVNCTSGPGTERYKVGRRREYVNTPIVIFTRRGSPRTAMTKISREQTNTRGQILALLCGANRTVAELAEAIGISRNAIRVHLNGLEAEGLVLHERLIRGVGKPAHLYRLTPAGERLLSPAYLQVLDGILRVLRSRLPARELETLLHKVGEELVVRRPKPSGGAVERVNAAKALLDSLGGNVEVDVHEGGAALRGRCCPVAAIAPDHPQICRAVEAMLSAFTGLPVREHCNQGGRPSCRFEISFGGEDVVAGIHAPA